MVSFQILFPEVMDQKKKIMDTNSNKRKWDDREIDASYHEHKSDNIQLHFDTPLPSEWQRCLNIQSGKIDFYNTRTHKRTETDPRDTQNDHISLDLELNLLPRRHRSSPERIMTRTTSNKKMKLPLFSESLSFMITKKTHNYKLVPPEGEEEAVVEMVATACMKCHMLVMLCKSSPTCPNCKFVHPPYQTPSPLFNPKPTQLSSC